MTKMNVHSLFNKTLKSDKYSVKGKDFKQHKRIIL